MTSKRIIQLTVFIFLGNLFISCNEMQSLSENTSAIESDNNSELEDGSEIISEEPPLDPGPWYKLKKPEKSDSSQKIISLCNELGQRSKKFGIHKFIIAFEGLASFNSKGTEKIYAEYEKNPMMNHLDVPKKSGSGGFMLYYLLWPVLAESEATADFVLFPETSIKDNQKNSQPELCARSWLKAHPKGRLIISGHSYGGHAANQLADILAQSNTPIDSVITIDPRTKRYRGDLGKTRNTDLWLNFYQTNTLFLNGYKVPNADANINLSKTGISHGKIPGRPEVQNALLEILLTE